MRIYILFFCSLLFFFSTKAQYKFNRVCYTDKDSIDPIEFPYDLVSYKQVDGILRIYKSISYQKLVILDLSPETFTIRRIDTISGFTEVRVRDVLPLPNFDVIIKTGQIIAYNRTTKSRQYHRYLFGDSKYFSQASKINDSLVLLSDFGNSHPLDGFAGLELHIFNVNTFEIVRSRTLRVPGVALAQLGIATLTTLNERIYFISSLSKELYCFNANLDLAYRQPLAIDNLNDNLEYERESDSLVYNTWDRTYNSFVENYGNVTDSLKDALRSIVYSGQFVSELSKKVRSRYDFVEKLLPYNNHTLLIAVAKRNNSPFRLRDMYFYDTNSRKIKKSMPDWANGRPVMCAKVEDYFPACVSNTKTMDISFFNNKIYSAAFYSPDAFVPATKDSLDKIMYNINKKSGYKWKLLEYQLN